jgi:hypothetical protein
MAPLSWAAYNGHVCVVQLLVERGADTETNDEVRCAAPARRRAERAVSACALQHAGAVVRRQRAASASA